MAVVCPYDLGVPGGVQDQATRLVRWLDEAGHDAVLVGPGEAGPDGAILLGATTAVRMNRSQAPVALRRRVVAAVREAVADADLVHVHEPFVPLVGIASLEVGSAVKVATFHADPSAAIRRLYSVGRPIARSLLSPATALTAVSETAASAVRRIRPVTIIPNGIDVSEYGIGDRVPGRVVFVGRDDPRKGLDTLIEAWPAVVAAVPGATLEVVGVDRADRGPGVTFRGRVDEAGKRAALAAAEVLVAPNTGAESFGIVVLEAMASGCAVVASAIPAFAALLGGVGELVAAGDAAGLATRVAAVLGDERKRVSMAAGGRRRAEEYDGPMVTARYLAVYQEAAALAS